ncbi:MAG TPA: chromosome segregation protein SMC [Candidatus Hydrogenedentes bacterium]|nr:chromosome segregation protein SMC [Candidatus Hydrogenedentota bacterium]
MYFKQVELTGFKSFADRTVLPLEPGVTAVVGPNGCGKSNILDAMRWALGEQSAKALRGAHMQDVIFNGNSQRPPTGMAEVSLTFDNADAALPVDFSEVQITRRVYRSGEGEYFINKAPCRLKDIQELFMDTGVGTNAYSLIGQGKIDLVISSRPEDRRFLFEEAAGIIKYKTRKRVAMRKLESADQNMLRLGDIIAEVERQMRSLKRQVNAAIRHREITQALRELEVRNAWLQFNELSGQIADLREKLAAATDTHGKLSADASRLEAQEEELNLRRIELERELHERREREHAVDTEMERLESQAALLRQEIEFCNQRAQAAAEERLSLEERAKGFSQDKGAAGERAEALRAEIERTEAALAEAQAARDAAAAETAGAEHRLEECRRTALDAVNLRNRFQTEIETLGATLAGVLQQLEALDTQSTSQEERRAQIAAQVGETRAKHAATEKDREKNAAERAKLEEKRRKAAARLAELNTKWQNLREEKSAVESRVTSLKELRDSYEGFATGVRAVMMAKQRDFPGMGGIIGPVGDLISTDAAYLQAIEAALGGNINNVIVENADDAKAAIAFLKEHKAGRVTFLPLDTIRPGRHEEELAMKGVRGVIGLAIDRVQCEARLMPAVEYLLYNTVIVETIDDAIRIARTEKKYPRMVTLEGEMISPAGAVTGGRTQRETQGLLGRTAEIEDLEKRAEQAKKDIAATVSEAAGITERQEAAAAQAKELDANENALRAALNELGVLLARQSTELEALGKTGDQLQEQRERLARQQADLETRQAEARGRLETASGDDSAHEQRVADARADLEVRRTVLMERTAALSDLRVRLAELTQNLEEAARLREREEREHEQALREAEKRVGLAQEMRARIAEIENKITGLLEAEKALSGDREAAHGRVLESQRAQQALMESVEALAKKLRGVRDRLNSAQKEIHRLELDCTQKEDRVQFFQERIAVEYGLALGSLTEEQVGEDDLDEREREERIKQHRQSLERLGNVNLAAIEEYDALEKREKFLKGQADDLSRARDALLGVIKRIDDTITQMFLDTFNEVARHFTDYFRRLFNGGQARIYLLDENDPLECGIEIEARPPGKKPQSISLLSGGEQAMTAIALLVSVFAAKPSPFCVLDEVDAPLDDANVKRFLDVIAEFTEHSQFIIITHNKETMARASALYGVTQQESGVSQIVSVRLEEARAAN